MNYNTLVNDNSNGYSKPVSNSFVNSFDFDYNTNTFNISWDNTAQTVTDPYLTDGGKVTLNKKFLPISKIDLKLNERFNKAPLTAPTGYLIAILSLFRGSNMIREIPVMFNISFSETISASYAKEHPVGSTEPIVAFNYTGEETFPFSFTALADYIPKGFSSLRDYVEAIKSIVKPTYSDSIVLPPYLVLSFADISVKCICESIDISYDPIYYYNYNGNNAGAFDNKGTFAKADIRCQFTKIRDI